jgi:hypothetical protein
LALAVLLAVAGIFALSGHDDTPASSPSMAGPAPMPASGQKKIVRVESWYGGLAVDTQGPRVSSSNAVRLLRAAPESERSFSEFPVQTLSVGEQFTIAFDLNLDRPLAEYSAPDLRVALMRGDGDANLLVTNMQGIVIGCGIRKGKWSSEVFEYTGSPVYPGAMTGLAWLRRQDAAKPWAPVSDMSVAITIKRVGGDLYSFDGHWGDEAFSFNTLRMKKSYSDFSVLAVLLGNKAGSDVAEFTNIRLER